jgi:hypothetical protein
MTTIAIWEEMFKAGKRKVGAGENTDNVVLLTRE